MMIQIGFITSFISLKSWLIVSRTIGTVFYIVISEYSIKLDRFSSNNSIQNVAFLIIVTVVTVLQQLIRACIISRIRIRIQVPWVVEVIRMQLVVAESKLVGLWSRWGSLVNTLSVMVAHKVSKMPQPQINCLRTMDWQSQVWVLERTIIYLDHMWQIQWLANLMVKRII